MAVRGDRKANSKLLKKGNTVLQQLDSPHQNWKKFCKNLESSPSERMGRVGRKGGATLLSPA